MVEDEGSRHELAARLNAVVVHLNRRLRRSDLDLGLPTAQASALTLLVSAGRHTIGDLAGYEQVAAPTMTRVIAALEQRGLVLRTRSAQDQRVVHVEATPAGAALIRHARRNRLSALEAQLAALRPGDLAAVAAAVPALEALSERPQPLS